MRYPVVVVIVSKFLLYVHKTFTKLFPQKIKSARKKHEKHELQMTPET